MLLIISNEEDIMYTHTNCMVWHQKFQWIILYMYV